MNFEQLIENLHINYWAIQVLLVVLGALVTNRVIAKVLEKLEKRFLKTKNVWDEVTVRSLTMPVYFLVYVIAISFCAQIIYTQFDITLLSIVYSMRDVAVIALIGWFLLRVIKEGQDAFIEKREKNQIKVSRTAIDGIANVSLALVVISIILVTLQTLGFEIGGILALGGVGGIAIGFAAKDLLSNFFGGLMIYFDRPFKVGDWVRSPDKEIEGTVMRIGWRQTQILTFSNRPLYIPNSVFSTIIVENPSRMKNRRIYETISIRYCDVNKISKIVDEVRNMLDNSELIDQTQTIIVNVDKFASSSIDFFVYTYTRTVDWVEFHEVKQKILLDIAQIIEDNQSAIAFPTSNVNFTAAGNDKPLSPLDGI